MCEGCAWQLANAPTAAWTANLFEEMRPGRHAQRVSPFAECLGTTLNFVLTTREDGPHGLVGGREKKERRKKEGGIVGPFYGGAAPPLTCLKLERKRLTMRS